MKTFEEWFGGEAESFEDFLMKKAWDRAMQEAKEHYEAELVALDNYYQHKMRATAGIEEIDKPDETNSGKLT